MISVVFLQPPSPPGMDVTRDYAGGFGIAVPSNRNSYGHWRWTVPHVSLMYSAGVLKREGHEIGYVDAQAERMTKEATIAKINQLNPSMVVSVINLPSVGGDGQLLTELRREVPEAMQVCIGTVCRAIPEELAKLGFADVLVLGDPEIVLPNLTETVLSDGDIHSIKGIGIVNEGKLHRTDPSIVELDLASLPWPPYDMMPMKRYSDMSFGSRTNCLPVWASRGCPRPCSFYCPHSIGLGKTSRIRPPEDVVEEMDFLQRRYSVSAFVIRDQIFSANPREAEEICELIINRRMRIQWVCESRFDMVSGNLLRKMRKAGCKRIHYGLETGDPDLLHEMGKPGMRIQTVKRAVNLTKEAGITPMTHIIVGLPGETRQTIQNTMRTIRNMGITMMNVNIATPYPGTQLYEFASKRGWIETTDWSQYSSFKAIMRTETLSTDELERLRDTLAEEFLGVTPWETIVYLCKSKGIVDYISSVSTHLFQNPSLIVHLLRSYISNQDLRSVRSDLRKHLNHAET